MLSNREKYLIDYFKIIGDDVIIEGKDTSETLFSFVEKNINKLNINFISIIDENYYIRESLFKLVISYDPTKKLIYSQWLLTILTKIIKTKKNNLIKRFIFEDLENISENLKLFDSLKKKKIFKEVSKNNFSLSKIIDPCNINQYYDSEVLYDAIFPFLERDESGLFGELIFYKNLGEAEIPFEDKNYLVYIPKTRRASVILHQFANWCTARPENSNFNTYTSEKSSLNKNSKLYVFIRKNDYEMFQIHFETSQLHDKSNKSNVNFFISNFLNNSYGLDRYLYNEIFGLIMACKKENYMKIYISSALKLGYSNVLIDQYSDNIEKIRIDENIIRLQFSLSRFKNLENLIFNKCGLVEISEEILLKKNLRILALPNNKITKIPENINQLKKLYILNLNNNNINEYPENISDLDPSNGGSLIRLSISNNNLSNQDLSKLRKLLPNVSVE